jgi:stage IV sporulation protein FB
MLLGEPPQTRYDLRFHVFGIPVRVHPWFWAIVVILGISGGGETPPIDLLIWVGCVFVSILVHELGHAFTALAYGWKPWITLYGFGGLASYQPTRHDWRSQVIISFAGPLAGFLFIGLIMGAVQISGHTVQLLPETPLSGFHPLFPPWAFFVPFDSGNLNTLIWYLWQINILWGLLNLLPIYPLDGGQIARELCLQGNRARGIEQSLWISIATAGGVVVFCLLSGEIYLAFMFGYLAYTSYTLLQQFSGGGYGGGRQW